MPNVWEWDAWNYDLADRSLDRRGRRKTQGKPWNQLSYTDLEQLGTPKAKKRIQQIDDELDAHFPELKLAKKWFPLPSGNKNVKDTYQSQLPFSPTLALNLLRNAYMMHGNVPDLSFESTGQQNLELYADILASHQKAAKSFRGNDQQMRDEFHRQMKPKNDSVHWVESTDGSAIIRLPDGEHIASVHGTTEWLNPDGTLSRDARNNFRDAVTNTFGVDVSDHTVSQSTNPLIKKHGVKTAISYSKGSYEASFMPVDNHISYDGHLPAGKPTARKTTVIGNTRSILQNMRGPREYIDNIYTVNPLPTEKSGLGYVKDAHSLRHFGTTMHMDPSTNQQNLSQIAGEAQMMQSMSEALRKGSSFSDWALGFGGHNPPSKGDLGFKRISYLSQEPDLWEQLGGKLSPNEELIKNRGKFDRSGNLKLHAKPPARANPHLVKEFQNTSSNAEGIEIVNRHQQNLEDYTDLLEAHSEQMESSARLRGNRIKGAHMKYGTMLNTMFGIGGQMGLDPTIGKFLRDHGVPEPVVQGLENGVTTSAVTKWLEKSRGLKLPGGALRAGVTSGVGAVVGAAIADPVYSSLRNAHLDPVAASTATGAIVGASGSAATMATEGLASVGSNVLRGARAGSVVATVGEAAMGTVRGVQVGMAIAEGAMNILGGAALLAVQALVTAWTDQKSKEADNLMGELFSTVGKADRLNRYLNRWGEEMVREGLRSQDWLEDLKQNPVYSAQRDAQGSFFDEGFGHGHTKLLNNNLTQPEAQAVVAFLNDELPALNNLNQLQTEQFLHTTEQIFTPFSGMHSIRDIREHPTLFNSEAGQSFLANHWATYYADHLNPVLYENYIRTQIQNSLIDSIGETGNPRENHLMASAIAAAEMSILPHDENHPYNLLPGQHTDGTFDTPAAAPEAPGAHDPDGVYR